MDAFNLKSFLRYAVMLIRENTIVLWSICFIGLCSGASLLFTDTAFHWPLNSLTIGLSIIATPIFYGIYFELIEDRYSSIVQISRTYVLSYLWLLLRMYLPVLFIATLPLFLIPGSGGSGYFEVTLIFFSLVYIYVIPTYYLSGQQRGAISTGVLFLINNLYKSTPIIFTVLLLETLMLLMHLSKNNLAGQGSLIFAILDFSIYLAASLIDLTVFIILIYILKSSMQERMKPQDRGQDSRNS